MKREAVKEAPLFVQTIDLCRWLVANLAGPPVVTERVHRHALDLLEAVAWALKGFERQEQVERADRSAAALRVHLRLAWHVGALDDARHLFLAEQLDSIGRQIGGWLKRLESDTLGARRR